MVASVETDENTPVSTAEISAFESITPEKDTKTEQVAVLVERRLDVVLLKVIKISSTVRPLLAAALSKLSASKFSISEKAAIYTSEYLSSRSAE